MYKTLYSVTVHPIQGDPATFSDNDITPGAASAVLAQLTANKDLDSTYEDDGDIAHVIIPLHAVDYAEVTEQRTESEYEDDNAKNCTEGGSGGETGTLTITNPGDHTAVNIFVSLLLGQPATYSGIPFSVVTESGSTFIRGTIPSIAAEKSFVLEGIPVGTMYAVSGATEATEEGIIPGEAILDLGS